MLRYIGSDFHDEVVGVFRGLVGSCCGARGELWGVADYERVQVEPGVSTVTASVQVEPGVSTVTV